MDRQYDKFFQTIERMVHKYNQMEKRKSNYGMDFPISCAEIHVIDEVGRNPGIGVRSIAKNKGVTEGAVSQLVKRLITKELIKKQVSAESEAKVELNLTEKGLICFREHNEYHRKENVKWYAVLDQIEDEDYLRIRSILLKMDKMMEE